MRIIYFGSYNRDYPRNKILIKGLRQNGVEVIEIHDQSSFWLVKYVKLFLRHRYYRQKYDYLVVGFPGFTIVPLAKLISTAPVVFDVFVSYYDSHVFDRGSCRPGSLKAGYYYCLDWLSCWLADIVLLDTNEQINYFVETFKLARNKFIRIFVGADDEAHKLLGKQVLISQSDEATVLFWGSMLPLHGIEYILKAAALLSTKKIKFIIIGDGQEKTKALVWQKKLSLSKVTLLGNKSKEELAQYIQKADICLGIFGSTPKAERVIPNKVYESLGWQKPIITADTPAARELLIDQKHCLFCLRASPSDLAEKIELLVNKKGLADSIAKNGHKLYQEKCTPLVLGQELLSNLARHL